MTTQHRGPKVGETLSRVGHRRRRARALAPAAGLAALSLVAAACGGGAAASSGSQGSGHHHATSGATSGHKAMLARITTAVNQQAAQPKFATYANGYGAAVKDVQKLKGDKVMIVPGNSQLAACAEIAQAEKVLAGAVGVKATIFSSNGGTSNYDTAINDAISQGYTAIDLECDLNPATVTPGIAKAEKAGLKVVTYGATPKEVTQSKVDANTTDTYALDGKVAAEQAVEQHHGKAFQAIAITSNAAPATPILQHALTHELHRLCPACKLYDVNVPVPQWTTEISSTLTSALLKHPKATVVFPDYAGMLSYMVSGIEAAHRTKSIKSYLAFGGGTPEMQTQAKGVGHRIIQSDIGGYPVWTGYLLFVQTAKVLAGQKPIPAATGIGPNRLATPQNVDQFLKTGGWGTSFVNGFRHMVHLPSLQGNALVKASTLSGTMTAKP